MAVFACPCLVADLVFACHVQTPGSSHQLARLVLELADQVLELADQVAADLVHLVDVLVDLVELPGPGPWSLARRPPTR